MLPSLRESNAFQRWFIEEAGLVLTASTMSESRMCVSSAWWIAFYVALLTLLLANVDAVAPSTHSMPADDEVARKPTNDIPSLTQVSSSTVNAVIEAEEKQEIKQSLRGPLKICIMVEPSPLTYVSGYANRFQALLQHLADKDDDDVQLITAEAVAKHPVKEYKGIPVHYTHGIRFPSYPNMSVSTDWTLRSFRVLLRTNPDLLHVSSPGFMVLGAVLYARLLQIPLVASYHTHLPVYVRTYLPPRRWWTLGISLRALAERTVWLLIRLVHSQTDLTLVTSPQIQQEFLEHGLNGNRVAVWQKGIDTDRFNPLFRSDTMRERMTGGRRDCFLVVYIGRLASEKRLQQLRDILERLPKARLCLVGTGPQHEDLEKYFAESKSCRDRTVFLGQLSGRELSEAFASADVFCMPSNSETLGFVVLESMASGVPVVAAKAGGIPHMIHEGVSGYLIDPYDDTDAYVAQLLRLQEEPELRRQMGEAGRKETLQWSWEASMSKLREEQYAVAQQNFEKRFERRLFRMFNFRKTDEKKL